MSPLLSRTWACCDRAGSRSESRYRILPLEGSVRGDARALVKGEGDVCDACVLQEHDGRRATTRQADDGRVPSSQPTPHVTGGCCPPLFIPIARSLSRIDGPARLLGTW